MPNGTGSVALISTFVMIVANALGLVVAQSDVTHVVQWVTDGVAVVGILIGIYRHWVAKSAVTSLTNQVHASGSIAVAGPAAGVQPSPLMQAKAQNALESTR